MKVQSNGKKALDKQAKKALKRSLKKVKPSPGLGKSLATETNIENPKNNALKININEKLGSPVENGIPNGQLMSNGVNVSTEFGIETTLQRSENPTNRTFNHSS